MGEVFIYLSLSIYQTNTYICVSLSVISICLLRNMTKMEDAKVEIDDGKEESALPDTVY